MSIDWLWWKKPDREVFGRGFDSRLVHLKKSRRSFIYKGFRDFLFCVCLQIVRSLWALFFRLLRTKELRILFLHTLSLRRASHILWRICGAVFLREQWAAAECEVFVCGERRDSGIKLAQRVLSRLPVFIYNALSAALLLCCQNHCQNTKCTRSM